MLGQLKITNIKKTKKIEEQSVDGWGGYARLSVPAETASAALPCQSKGREGI